MTIDEYKKDYFTKPNLEKIGMPIYAVRTALIKAISELKLSISGEVLDIGCGVMPYKEFLLDDSQISKYIGVDLEPTEYHYQVKPDFFWDGKHIPLPDDSVDWVIATEFFEHYFDMTSILSEIRRVLKKDGKLFFTVPFIWTLHETPYDEYRYTPFSLEKLLSKTSFSEINIKSLGGFNRSLATMLGLWLEYAGIKKKRRKLLRLFIKPFFKYLIKTDSNYARFQNHQMPSGLYGYATANK